MHKNEHIKKLPEEVENCVILYSNSDSYGVFSKPGETTPYGDVYGKFIADQVGSKFINRGRSGSSNSRILRTSMRDLIRLRRENPNKKIQALISLATTYRSESWTEENIHPEDQDGHFKSFQASSGFTFWTPEQKDFAKHWVAQYDNEAEQTNLLWQVLMFTNTLKSYNIDYLVWWGSPIGVVKPIEYTNPFIEDFYQEFKKDKNILSFEDFGFCSWCLDRGFVPFDKDVFGEYGHHGPEAHKAFADWLLENYL